MHFAAAFGTLDGYAVNIFRFAEPDGQRDDPAFFTDSRGSIGGGIDHDRNAHGKSPLYDQQILEIAVGHYTHQMLICQQVVSLDQKKNFVTIFAFAYI